MSSSFFPSHRSPQEEPRENACLTHRANLKHASQYNLSDWKFGVWPKFVSKRSPQY